MKSICLKPVFDAIYRKHAEGLRNFLYYKTGNAQEAEDIMQEAFLKLWKNCNKVEEGKAKSFIYKVSTNFFLNKIRRKKVELKFQQSNQLSTESPSPEYIYRQEEFKKILEQTISDLPENQREVFLMNRMDGLKYVEIAALLEVSVKTVEKRMSAALKILRKLHAKI